MRIRKLLITGAAGFIGFHLVKKLLGETDLEIVGIDNINDYYDIKLKFARLEQLGIDSNMISYSTQIESKYNSRFKFIKLDIADEKKINTLFENESFNYIINLAAQAGVRYSFINPHSYLQSNILGFFNLLNTSIKYDIKHFIYASSSSVYGLNSKKPYSTLDNVDHPISLYAATKKANELFAHSFSYNYNLPTTGLRFFTVYGPWGRPDMAYYKFTQAILNNEPIQVYNNGKMMRDFTYIDDIINAIVKVLCKIPKRNESIKDLNPSFSSVPFKIYNLGNSKPIQLLDFINIIESTLNKKAKLEFLPIQKGDVEETYAEISDSKLELEFIPKTEIKEGINVFIDWYLDFTKSKKL